MTSVPRRREGTAVDEVAERVRREILSGLLAPGERLGEERLAARLGVSRHTLRTALARLTASGLVQAPPYRGVFVTRFDAAQARSLQELRRALESEAVRMLSARAGGGPWPVEVLAPIDEAVLALADAERIAGGGPDGGASWLRVQRAHSVVHHAIVAAAGSARIIAAHTGLLDEIDLLMLHARDRYAPGALAPQHRGLVADVQRLGPPAIIRHLDDMIERLDAGRDRGDETGRSHSRMDVSGG